MMRDEILKTIKELREKSKKRNFSQTFDLIIGLKEFDTKKPGNKFSEDVLLPRGRGKEANVIVFSDSLKDLDCEIFNSGDIQNLVKNKRETKKLVSQTEFFLAEAPLMPLIGKSLGQALAPCGKMPRIISDEANSLVKKLKNSVKIRVKDSPVIQCLVGKEEMKDDDVAENVEAVLNFLETKLPKGKHNIKEVLLKLTMSKPIKVM
jgi:large subunit ribosomal protein L1